MLKDAHVTQISELRIFAQASSRFGEEVIYDCHRGIETAEDARRSAEYFRNLVRRKVEEADAQLSSAKKALDAYESQDHTDKDGNSTYNHAYAAQLRASIRDAELRLAQAKEDQQLVEERYIRVRNEVDDMVTALSLAASEASGAASTAYRQISHAASILEQEYQ